MFDIAMTELKQLVELLPALICIWVLFDLIGALFFKNE